MIFFSIIHIWWCYTSTNVSYERWRTNLHNLPLLRSGSCWRGLQYRFDQEVYIQKRDPGSQHRHILEPRLIREFHRHNLDQPSSSTTPATVTAPETLLALPTEASIDEGDREESYSDENEASPETEEHVIHLETLKVTYYAKGTLWCLLYINVSQSENTTHKQCTMCFGSHMVRHHVSKHL